MGVWFQLGIFVVAFFHEGTEVRKGKKMGGKECADIPAKEL